MESRAFSWICLPSIRYFLTLLDLDLDIMSPMLSESFDGQLYSFSGLYLWLDLLLEVFVLYSSKDTDEFKGHRQTDGQSDRKILTVL